MSGSHVGQPPTDLDAPRPTRVAALVVYAALALCVVLLLGTVNRGFGLTDEAFYVAWIGAPEQYKATITPFGPPLHLLFALLGRSLIALRIAGIALLLVSGALLGRALSRYYHAVGLTRMSAPVLTALGAIAGLSYYALWIMTPSYNLLANAGGALIVAGAIEWATADLTLDRRRALIAAVLIGMGGCIAFFGKPPLAGVAGLCIAGLAIHTIHRRGLSVVVPRLLVVLAACLVPLIAIVALSGGVPTFIGKIAEGVRVLNFGNSPLSIPLKTFRDVFQIPLLVLTLVLLVLVLAWSRGGPAGDDRPQLRRAFAAMLGFVGLYAMALLAKSVFLGERAWTFVGLPTACLAMVVLAVGALRGKQPLVPWRVLAPVIILLLVPFATALGTANRFVHQTGASLYGFLLAAPIAAWIYMPRKSADRVAAVTATFTLAVLLWSAAKPYGLTGTILAENTPMRVPFSSDTVLVSPETRRYADALRQVAAVGRLSPTTPIVDLSEGGPGTALLLNAGAPYYPWIIHETKVQGSLADETWRSLDATQQRGAWIVGPIRAEFAHTGLGRMLLARRGCYRRFEGLRKVFWDQPKVLEVWVPRGGC